MLRSIVAAALIALLSGCFNDVPFPGSSSDASAPGHDAGRPDGGCAGQLCGSQCCTDQETCDTTARTCQPICVPLCGKKQCGDNGCQGSCGSCLPGTHCDQASGQCVACAPVCAGRDCGDDGCSSTCGDCSTGKKCDASGHCASCSAECGVKKCGSDGCSGSCGDCPLGQSCDPSGQCAPGCKAVGVSCEFSSDCCSRQCSQGLCADCQGDALTCGGKGCCAGLSCDRGVCRSCHLTGAGCTVAGDCCSGSCSGGLCRATCGEPGGSCTKAADCCASSLCPASSCCSRSGTGCTSGAECCSGACTDFLCGCTALQGPCGMPGDCCAGTCSSQGTCCLSNGSTCSASADCCGGGCQGTCCATNGTGCSAPGDCCSGNCKAGTCACQPQCNGKTCGADGCGSTCGSCDPGTSCDPTGTKCVAGGPMIFKSTFQTLPATGSSVVRFRCAGAISNAGSRCDRDTTSSMLVELSIDSASYDLYTACGSPVGSTGLDCLTESPAGTLFDYTDALAGPELLCRAMGYDPAKTTGANSPLTTGRDSAVVQTNPFAYGTVAAAKNSSTYVSCAGTSCLPYGSCGVGSQCCSGVCSGDKCSCTPKCSGRVCGGDGCGSTCGSCSTGTCDLPSGQCIQRLVFTSTYQTIPGTGGTVVQFRCAGTVSANGLRCDRSSAGRLVDLSIGGSIYDLYVGCDTTDWACLGNWQPAASLPTLADPTAGLELLCEAMGYDPANTLGTVDSLATGRNAAVIQLSPFLYGWETDRTRSSPYIECAP